MAKKVLVVEDNLDSLEVLEILLTHQGYDVVTAEDGRTGLEKAEAELPDLILTDMRMPVLSGPEMVKHLRQNPQFSRTPIIVLTADVDGQAKAIEAGANDILIKPVAFERLTSIIKTYLG